MIFLNILSILKTAGLVIGGLFLGTLSLFYFFQNKILYIPCNFYYSIDFFTDKIII